MKSIARRLVTVALVGLFALMWRIDTARDVLSAQTRKPVVVTRLYTGPDGQTHAEEIAAAIRDFLAP